MKRYINISLTLLFSGIGHVIEGAYSGVPPSQSGALLFFPSFAIGILIEDAAQKLFPLVNGEGDQGKKEEGEIKDGRVPLWRRMIGFVWVFAWFVALTPILLYPNLRRDPEAIKGTNPVVVDWIGMPSASAILGVGGLVLLFGFGAEI